MVGHAASGMVARISVGLPLACSSLDDAAAAAMLAAILRAEAAIGLMDDAEGRAGWHASLERLVHSDSLHGRVAGGGVRILFDAHVLEADETARLMNLSVSTASEPPRAAAWVEGFLSHSGEVLYHDDALFGIFDGWLAELSEEAFPNLLPILRRTFGTFEPPLRRNLGERAARAESPGGPKPAPRTSEIELDGERAASVLPLVAKLLGLDGGTKP
jgi:hypothetical protein